MLKSSYNCNIRKFNCPWLSNISLSYVSPKHSIILQLPKFHHLVAYIWHSNLWFVYLEDMDTKLRDSENVTPALQIISWTKSLLCIESIRKLAFKKGPISRIILILKRLFINFIWKKLVNFALNWHWRWRLTT